MDTPKTKTFVVAVNSSDPDLFAKKLADFGETLTVFPSLYLVATQRSGAEIILAFDPLKVRSVKALFVIQTGHMLWASLGSDRDAAIQSLLERGQNGSA